MVFASGADVAARRYVWGLDMSGLNQSRDREGADGVANVTAASPPGIHGAGGIGGLLAMEDIEVIESEGMMMSGPAVSEQETLLEQSSPTSAPAAGGSGGTGVSPVIFTNDAGSTAAMTLVDPSDFESGGTLEYVDASSNTASLVLVDVQDVTEDLAALTFADEFGNEGVALASRGGGTTVTTPLWYCYDANGNVGQVIDPTTGAIQAAYEYGPYGTRVGGGGPYWGVNPFRFSTKYADDETGDANGENYLCYYGYRYYSPRLGRWVSRDPSAERGGLNLYVFTTNAPANGMDFLGLQASQPPSTATDCEYCGPDMMPFFTDLLNETLKWRRGLGAVSRQEGIWWLYRNGPNLDWDARKYKAPGCATGKVCKNTYWLCGECVHDHWIGNFMFGFIARLFWIPDWQANAGGEWFQSGAPGDPPGEYDDPPWDVAGYSLARLVASRIREEGHRELASGQICQILREKASLWRTANDTSVKAPSGTRYPTPRSVGYQGCAKCPHGLPQGVARILPGGSLGSSWPALEIRPDDPGYLPPGPWGQ